MPEQKPGQGEQSIDPRVLKLIELTREGKIPEGEAEDLVKKYNQGHPDDMIQIPSDFAEQLAIKNTEPASPTPTETPTTTTKAPRDEEEQPEVISENETEVPTATENEAETTEKQDKLGGIKNLANRFKKGEQAEETSEGEESNPNLPKSLTIPDEASHALDLLPKKQQLGLSGFSQELVNTLGDGVSSVVAPQIMEMLQKLPQAGQDEWWKLLLSPGEGWKALAAEAKEVGARAKLRNSIADSAMTIANLGEEESEREVFDAFISTLRKTVGEKGIQIFCQEHDIDLPEPGSQAEKVVLLRKHSADLAIARYREAIRDEMIKFMHEKAGYEGKTARSIMRTQMLPRYLQAKAEENPLLEKKWGQKVSHGTAMFTVTLGAGISGALFGLIGGFVVGGKVAWDWTAQKWEQVKASADAKMKSLKDSFNAKFPAN